MKNDIKKYLTLGAVLAGSAFMVSCDGDDVQVSEISAQSLADAIAAADSTSLSKIVSNDATFNVATTATNELVLTFGATTSTEVIFATSIAAGVTGWDLNSAIEAGDTIDLALATAHITYSGVTSAGGVITVPTLDVTTAADDDFSDLILTETASSTIGSDVITTGTFTMNADVKATAGNTINAASDLNNGANNGGLVSIEGAGSPGTFSLADGSGADDALESKVGAQPTVTVNGDVFTVAVGDTLFINGTELYVTDTNGAATSIPGTPTTNDLTVAIDVAAGAVVQLTSGTVAASTVALTGEYVSTIK